MLIHWRCLPVLRQLKDLSLMLDFQQEIVSRRLIRSLRVQQVLEKH
jgi:hypothetical protein